MGELSLNNYILDMVCKALREAKTVEEVKGAFNLFFIEADDRNTPIQQQWISAGYMIDLWRGDNL